jgi:hypothetical protein
MKTGVTAVNPLRRLNSGDVSAVGEGERESRCWLDSDRASSSAPSAWKRSDWRLGNLRGPASRERVTKDERSVGEATPAAQTKKAAMEAPWKKLEPGERAEAARPE